MAKWDSGASRIEDCEYAQLCKCAPQDLHQQSSELAQTVMIYWLASVTSRVMNINLSSTTTSQVYLGTSDVIKLAEYDYTSQHSGTMLLYQCKLHYTVYAIHGGSEQTDKTKVLMQPHSG